MPEIRIPLTNLAPGETYTAPDDGAIVITERNSHADIIRYVVEDIGEDARDIVERAITGQGS